MACMQKSANVVKQLNNMSSPSTFFGNLLDLYLSKKHVPCRFYFFFLEHAGELHIIILRRKGV